MGESGGERGETVEGEIQVSERGESWMTGDVEGSGTHENDVKQTWHSIVKEYASHARDRNRPAWIA